MRIPVIGVMGSGTVEHADLASPLGERLALEGFHLLTGGGCGVMEAVSRAFVRVPQGDGPGQRKGLALGIIPGEVHSVGVGHTEYKTKPGYPNRWVEMVIRTHLPLSGSDGKQPMSRNHLNILSSDFVVILPGGEGTKSEAELCVAYGKPSKTFSGAAELDGLMLELRRSLVGQAA